MTRYYGNVTSKIETRSSINYTQSYQYNGSHQISSMTLPSGRVVSYSKDALQRITAMDTSLNGNAQSVLSGVQYTATGQIKQRIYGNGLNESRRYDLQSRLIQTDLINMNQTLMSYDANSNLLNRQHDQVDNSYQYDELNRLFGETQGSINSSFNYDSNDNRTLLTTDSFTKTYGYAPQSNQLIDIDNQPISYDNAGNLTQDTQGRTYSYNNAGRLKDIQQNGQTLASYLYNSQGQRTQKTTSTNTTVYHYDLSGQLISETNTDGTPVKDYLWHNGNPIAQIDISGTEAISYLHSDHLQTAKLATDQNQAIIWRWEGNAFGDTPAQELAGIQINLRFPGQYIDEETNLHYNWNRYYDPATGRYITSDPIGLSGGVNTYGYVGGNPIRFFDSLGLYPACDSTILGAFDVISSRTEEQVLSRDYGFAFVMTGLSVSPDLDPRSPRRPPIKPSLRTEVWWAVKELLSIKTFELRKTFQKLKVFCTETLTDECGNTREFTANFERTELINEIKRLAGERIETREQLIRLLFAFDL